MAADGLTRPSTNAKARVAASKPGERTPPAKPLQAAKPQSALTQPALPQQPAQSRQARPQAARPSDLLEQVHAAEVKKDGGSWTEYLVLFLRVMAVASMLKGLYHWGALCGIGADAGGGFQAHTVAWQTATVFFAVIDLVAAVGLWLAAAWGAVVWLTSVVSMAVVEVFFPQVYGGSIFVVLIELTLLGAYLWLAISAAQERPA